MSSLFILLCLWSRLCHAYLSWPPWNRKDPVCAKMSKVTMQVWVVLLREKIIDLFAEKWQN
jgi:hypothetical protein